MTPEEVPDDLIEAFDKGSYERSCAYAGVSQIDGEKEYFRGGIAAVYDAIAKRVRTELSEELHERAMRSPNRRGGLRPGLIVASRVVAPKPTPDEIMQAIADGNYVACYLNDDGTPVQEQERGGQGAVDSSG